MITVRYEFVIPFDGGPADVCAQEIQRRITSSLLNSMSGIHPDIRCHIEKITAAPAWFDAPVQPNVPRHPATVRAWDWLAEEAPGMTRERRDYLAAKLTEMDSALWDLDAHSLEEQHG